MHVISVKKRALYQPLVAGWHRAGRAPTAPSTLEAAQGWKYYNACHAIIFTGGA